MKGDSSFGPRNCPGKIFFHVLIKVYTIISQLTVMIPGGPGVPVVPPVEKEFRQEQEHHCLEGRNVRGRTQKKEPAVGS